MSDFHSKAFENDKYFQLKYYIRKQYQKSTVQEAANAVFTGQRPSEKR
jgi:hypothetical protein